jgi:hypothetical protein
VGSWVEEKWHAQAPQHGDASDKAETIDYHRLQFRIVRIDVLSLHGQHADHPASLIHSQHKRRHEHAFEPVDDNEAPTAR